MERKQQIRTKGGVAGMNKGSFQEYMKESEPAKRDKSYAWHMAIVLQAVDGFQTSLGFFPSVPYGSATELWATPEQRWCSSLSTCVISS